MLFLTQPEKRQQTISEAVVLHVKGDPYWFRGVQERIDNGIFANPGKREQVLLKWILSAEHISATVVKEEILRHYEQKSFTSGDS
jgi:hypothetical protein